MKNQKSKIKNQKSISLFLIIILIGLLLPLVSLASAPPLDCPLPEGATGYYHLIIDPKTNERECAFFWGLVPCGGEGENPCQICHLFVMLDTIIDFALFRVLPPVATLMLVFGGIFFFGVAENPQKVEEAKKLLISVGMGLMVIYSAWVIITLFFIATGVTYGNIGPDDPAGWSTINCPIGDKLVTEPPDDPRPGQELPQGQTIVFVTEADHKGDFGGRAELDNFCETNKPGNLPSCVGTRAFISVDDNDQIQDMPEKYGFREDDPIYWWHSDTGETTLIEENWLSMLDKGPKINQKDGTGNSGFVWTGSWPGGEAAATCNNWLSSSEGWFGSLGHAWVRGDSWLNYDAGDKGRCNRSHHIRCICVIPD